MSEAVNLARKMETRLPAELVSFLQEAGRLSHDQGQKLWLVGGVVRDLFLGRDNFDLDLVLEGDAIALAKQLASAKSGKIATHPRFGTANIQLDKWSVDIVTARSETYTRPGALPTVKPGSISDDLARRDFTINTMAASLSPENYGELLDIFNGRNDLKQGLMRMLHDNNFIDDATRIWRALRYEQRLDFQMEPATLQLLKRDIAMLGTISSDRIRHELELVLKEEFPEKSLSRADELGVLARLHPLLKGDGWLSERFSQVRRLITPELPSVGFYMALLTYRLIPKDVEQLLAYLRPPRTVAQILRDTSSIKTDGDLLSDPGLSPSRVYAVLHGYSTTALTASLIAADTTVVKDHLNFFLKKLRYVNSALKGADLLRLGVPQGLQIREILNRLREARLDGKVKSKKEEEAMVAGWLGKAKY